MVGRYHGKKLVYDHDCGGKVLDNLQQECSKIRFTFFSPKINLPEQ